MTAPILRRLSEMRALRREWTMRGETVGLVPTMGALHQGHLSLVKAAKAACDRVVVTIFVNPKQFNNPADLANYPRTEEDDAQKLAPLGVDAIYVPDPDEIYPEGFATEVAVAGAIIDVMEGPFRPGHFEGVATVVAKLFLQTGADHAFFGEKDYQQLLVVRRMAQDMDIPITVVGCETVRETGGLAMSSRNVQLTPQGLDTAAHIYRILTAMAQQLRAGQAYAPLQSAALNELADLGFGDVEYLDLRCADTLVSLPVADRPARLFIAVWLEDVRLIDNIPV